MKAIPKQLREQAALVASAMACSPDSGTFTDDEVVETLDLSQEAIDIYWLAWEVVMRTHSNTDVLVSVDDPEWDAEAEAMLRDGWSPSLGYGPETVWMPS